MESALDKTDDGCQWREKQELEENEALARKLQEEDEKMTKKAKTSDDKVCIGSGMRGGSRVMSMRRS